MMANVFGMVTTRASAEYTLPALETFFQHTALNAEDQFLLIDNDGGWDQNGLSPALRARIELVVNHAPLSFAENGNQVIRRAAEIEASAYFLNNDIIFTPQWFPPVGQDHAAVLTPTCNQNYQYRTSRLELKPVMTLAEYRAGADQLPAVVEAHRAKNNQLTQPYKTNFFCVKIPPVIYRAVGLFDTRFGVAGGEDDDYCIRSYLSGFRVLVATGSYLVHFAGRSTWSGPETLAEWAKREKHFIGIFQRKWGPTISRFLLYRDHSVVGKDPLLQMVERERGIAGLFAEMIRRDGIAAEDAMKSSPRL